MQPLRKSAIAITMAVLLVAGCAKQVHPAHPNQVDSFDGYAYDALTVAQSTLDEAKVQLKAGKFDDRRSAAVEAINGGGAAYESARGTWLAYRDVVGGLKAGDPEALAASLRTDLANLSSALAAIKNVTGGKK